MRTHIPTHAHRTDTDTDTEIDTLTRTQTNTHTRNTQHTAHSTQHTTHTNTYIHTHTHTHTQTRAYVHPYAHILGTLRLCTVGSYRLFVNLGTLERVLQHQHARVQVDGLRWKGPAHTHSARAQTPLADISHVGMPRMSWRLFLEKNRRTAFDR